MFRRLCVFLQITKPFFSTLADEAVQQKLLSAMFDLLVESRSPAVANTISSVFKAVSRDRLLNIFLSRERRKMADSETVVCLGMNR